MERQSSTPISESDRALITQYLESLFDDKDALPIVATGEPVNFSQLVASFPKASIIIRGNVQEKFLPTLQTVTQFVTRKNSTIEGEAIIVPDPEEAAQHELDHKAEISKVRKGTGISDEVDLGVTLYRNPTGHLTYFAWVCPSVPLSPAEAVSVLVAPDAPSSVDWLQYSRALPAALPPDFVPVEREDKIFAALREKFKNNKT